MSKAESTVRGPWDFASDTTLPRVLAANAKALGDVVALREKDRGIWQQTTWAQWLDEVLCCAAGLEALGFVPGDALLTVGDNRPHLYSGMLAAGALRGFAMPVYPDAAPDEDQSVAGPAQPDVLVMRSLTKTWALAGLRGGKARLRCGRLRASGSDSWCGPPVRAPHPAQAAGRASENRGGRRRRTASTQPRRRGRQASERQSENQTSPSLLTRGKPKGFAKPIGFLYAELTKVNGG